MSDTDLHQAAARHGYAVGDVVRFWGWIEDEYESTDPTVGTITDFWWDGIELMAEVSVAGRKRPKQVAMGEILGIVKMPDLSSPEKVVDYLTS